MYVVRMSLRAFGLAMLPIAGFHLAFAAHDLTRPTMVILMRQLALQAILLLAVHGIARGLRIGSPTGYALLAAALTWLLQEVVTAPIFLRHAPYDNFPGAGILFPMLLAAGAAFLYARTAGTDWRPDTLTVSGSPVPLRVRTSKLAILIVALLPAFAALFCTSIVMLQFSGLLAGHAPRTPEVWMRVLTSPLYAGVNTLIISALPAAFVVYATHLVARAMHRAGGGDYAMIGAVFGTLGGALMYARVPMFLAIFPLAAIVGALMGACYRRIAGLEPRPLPEPVHVKDVSTLVPADHPDRRNRAVIIP